MPGSNKRFQDRHRFQAYISFYDDGDIWPIWEMECQFPFIQAKTLPPTTTGFGWRGNWHRDRLRRYYELLQK